MSPNHEIQSRTVVRTAAMPSHSASAWACGGLFCDSCWDVHGCIAEGRCQRRLGRPDFTLEQEIVVAD
jgi:hypothetical protein